MFKYDQGIITIHLAQPMMDVPLLGQKIEWFAQKYPHYHGFLYG